MKEIINTGFHSGSSYYYVGYGLPGELDKSYEWFSAKKKKNAWPKILKKIFFII